MSKGYIYIFGNPAFREDCYKIGRTERDPAIRASELYRQGKSGIPLPFEILHTREFEDCHKTEEILHEHFKQHRINEDREFFQIPLHQAIQKIDDLYIKELQEELRQQYIEHQKYRLLHEKVSEELTKKHLMIERLEAHI